MFSRASQLKLSSKTDLLANTRTHSDSRSPLCPCDSAESFLKTELLLPLVRAVLHTGKRARL